MTDMLTSKPLDKALDFNSENIFEYMDQLLCNMNADTSGPQAFQTTQELCRYIESLPLEDAESVAFEVESMVNNAITKNYQYSYKAGFMEACRLIRTLQSF